jgi:hypothetical protein
MHKRKIKRLLTFLSAMLCDELDFLTYEQACASVFVTKRVRVVSRAAFAQTPSLSKKFCLKKKSSNRPSCMQTQAGAACTTSALLMQVQQQGSSRPTAAAAAVQAQHAPTCMPL